VSRTHPARTGRADDAQVAAWERRWRELHASGEDTPAAPARSGAPRAAAVPAQLPIGVADFSVRTGEVAALRASCASEGAARGVSRVVVVSGPSGIGKTALALHVAHGVRDDYPDGQLYADMRGTSHAPAAPVEILSQFLHALGMNPGSIPQTDDALGGEYRNLLAHRRILMPLPEFATRDEAQAWYDLERANIVDLVVGAGEAGLDDLGWLLARSTWAYFNLRRHWSSWTKISYLGLESASRYGYPFAQSFMLNNLGTLKLARGAHDEAISWYERAAELGVEDPTITAILLLNLGLSHAGANRHEQAVNYFQQALGVFRQSGDRYGEAVCIYHAIPVHRALGHYDRALELCERHLASVRKLGSRYGEGFALYATAQTLLEAGRPAEGIGPAEQALKIRREIGDRNGEAWALEELGLLHQALGDHDAAREACRASLELFEDLESPAAATMRAHLAGSRDQAAV